MKVMVRWFVNHRRFFITFLILSSILATFLLYQFVFSPLYAIKDVSIREINSNPPSFDGGHVKLQGYLVNTSVYIFGPKYVLREFDDGVEIALGGKGGIEKVDLKPYVSFIFDGSNYTRIGDLRVSVVGYVRYIGLVTDAPSFYLDVEGVEPIVTELETIVLEFLKTTDVPNGGWDGTVEVKEVYDHKLGGKVMVVKYTTANGGHPDFFSEAIEHHVAVIALNMAGEIVSAFCVQGSFHEGRIWDLINQRWILQQAVIFEQQAMDVGKGFLDGIGYTRALLLESAKLYY